MSRRTFICIVCCLLCLFPALSQAQTLTRYEYWFDDNFGGLTSGSLNGSEAVLNTDIETDLLGYGVHKFSFRAKRSDGKYSAVTSSLFLKRPMAQSCQMEYWFDDNIDQRDIVSISNTEEEQTFNLDLSDNAKYPMGFHKLNIRIAIAGEGQSAVYSSGVLKLSGGTATKLEYWVDDYANVQTIDGTLAENGKDYKFINDLNLGDVSPGHHRLYCRPVSENRITAGAVTSVPIIVKSRYNVSPDDVKMRLFTIAVDDEEPVTINAQDSSDELVLNPYTINMRGLSTGNHTLKAHFWNTANAGVALEQTFRVNAIETPSVQLTAEENDGKVKLTFNAVPNGVKWFLMRKDASGVRVRVDKKAQDSYPSTITSIDTPPVGQYTYMVRTYYTNANGEEQHVNSDEVPVTVTASQNGPFGKIYGHVVVGSMPLWGEVWKVSFSDGVEMETDRYGVYYRDKIPVGTVLDISVQSRDFTSEVTTVTITEGENRIYHYGILDEEGVRARYSHDLQFDSNVEFIPRLYMKFKVKNINRLAWHGKLRIVTARKDLVDNPPMNPFDTNNGTQVLAGSMASFYVNDYYQYDYSDEVWIQSGESADVYIKHNVPITTPPTVQDEEYYFFIESVDEYGTKLVAVNNDYNFKDNPVVQVVDNGYYSTAEEDLATYVGVLMELCGTVTELDGKLGDMSRCMEEMQEELGYTLDYYALAEKIEVCSNVSHLRQKVPEWEFYHILFQEDRKFLGMVNNVRDKIASEVRNCKDAMVYLKKAKLCLDEVKNYNQWTDMTDLERAGAIADKILNMSESTFPFVKVLKSYLDITKKTVHNINGLTEKWDAVNAYSTFYSGAGIYNNSDFVFDIRVKKKGWIARFFDADDVADQILSAEIKTIGHVEGNARLQCTAKYVPSVQDGTVRLQRVSITGDNPAVGGEVPIEDMWMTIWWSNGRVSYIPIRSSSQVQGDGVTHDRNHYTITFQSKLNKVEHMADIINLDD